MSNVNVMEGCETCVALRESNEFREAEIIDYHNGALGVEDFGSRQREIIYDILNAERDEDDVAFNQADGTRF